jgi:hypothetical protein
VAEANEPNRCPKTGMEDRDFGSKKRLNLKQLLRKRTKKLEKKWLTHIQIATKTLLTLQEENKM